MTSVRHCTNQTDNFSAASGNVAYLSANGAGISEYALEPFCPSARCKNIHGHPSSWNVQAYLAGHLYMKARLSSVAQFPVYLRVVRPLECSR